MRSILPAALLAASCTPLFAHALELEPAAAQTDLLRPSLPAAAPDRARAQRDIWTRAPAQSRFAGIAAIAREEEHYVSGCSR